jgi:hydroxymethylglutaryl-CoA lyase/(R)-citramalyl-CoA lyase
VTVCDVGPRDGLQNEPDVVPPATRAELVRRLAAAGVPRIEAVSFVRDDRVPQMAGAEEVVAAVGEVEAELSGLVLNERGYDRFAATGLDRLNVTFAATESFNQRNGGQSLAAAVEGAERILVRAEVPATVTISVAFGCPFEGAVDPGWVAELAARFADYEVVFADTIGVAVPSQVRRLMGLCTPAHDVGVHLHNTRNTGYANAIAALEAGATVLDASVGGIGGCPFAPRATGNVATEDLVYLLHGEGAETGIDLDALIEVSRWLEGVLGRPLPGLLARV